MKQPQIVTNWEQVPVVIDLPFAARILGQSIETLKKRSQRGELPGAFKAGRDWRINKDALRSYIEGRPQ
ncbi:MAG: helix-turn-helix domain-containing protein [Oscillospiraceae bacterium]|nr:helix-turn-helix domain-containing protein [Oscillospiraceae bacterium]